MADEKHQAKAALSAGKVDVLTLSPIWMPDEGIEKFAKLGFEHNPNIRITVQEFWLPNDTYEPIYPEDFERCTVPLLPPRTFLTQCKPIISRMKMRRIDQVTGSRHEIGPRIVRSELKCSPICGDGFIKLTLILQGIGQIEVSVRAVRFELERLAICGD